MLPPPPRVITVSAWNWIAGHVYPGGSSRIVWARRYSARETGAWTTSPNTQCDSANAVDVTRAATNAAASTAGVVVTGFAARRRASVVSVMFPPRRDGQEAWAAARGAQRAAGGAP